MLIAVDTGGLANALRTGGVVARSASGALLVYDAAGNAVGSVQGIYDASKNGVNLTNGAQIFAGTLGLSANASAIKQVPPRPRAEPVLPAPAVSDAPPKPVTAAVEPSRVEPPAGTKQPQTGADLPEFYLGKHGLMPSPRPGRNSHHGVMSEWMRRNHSAYDPKRAPAIMMPVANHHETCRVYNKWRAEKTRSLGGTFDWSKVTEADMRALSEKMFDAAKVPQNLRDQYWQEFERMKSALRRQARLEGTGGIDNG